MREPFLLQLELLLFRAYTLVYLINLLFHRHLAVLLSPYRLKIILLLWCDGIAFLYLRRSNAVDLSRITHIAMWYIIFAFCSITNNCPPRMQETQTIYYNILYRIRHCWHNDIEVCKVSSIEAYDTWVRLYLILMAFLRKSLDN